jgi:2-oxoisovalerate dehydrogenase E2 component (dihydrolipoyl transacylase)
MGSRSILMPDVGEGVAEAEIVEWTVQVGDLVKEDQIVAGVMTDKATVEIPTPVTGTVLHLGGAVGDVLAVGSELIRIDAPGLPDLPHTPPPMKESSGAKAPVEPPKPREADLESRVEIEPSTRAPTPIAARQPGERPLASAAVRLRAREAGIDLRRVRASGPAGRIMHDDLATFLRAPTGHEVPGRGRRPDLSVETIKVVGLRRRIAQNMAESTRRVAHFSYVEEVDVNALEELRSALNAQANDDRPRLTLLPFLLLALVKAIGDFPQINAHFDDEEDVIRRLGAVHVGVATQTPGGLTVPVVRHAETLGLYEVAREVKRVTEAARAGLGAREEMSGSTITLTSLGALGGIVSTPVINRPEVAIVGVNKIVVRPVWRDGSFVPRKTMNLSSSFDHRVIDGWDAASFIQRVRGLLETPALIFIER